MLNLRLNLRMKINLLMGFSANYEYVTKYCSPHLQCLPLPALLPVLKLREERFHTEIRCYGHGRK
jgi:hypothetical protein